MNGMATVKGPTGYPSVDKPWLIHYPRQAMDEPLPEGRMKRMIMTIYDGVVYKVFPEIIADQLSHGGSVSNISIVGDTRGKDLVLRACVIPSPEYKGDIKQLEEDLRAYAGQHLSMYMRPVYYSFCTEFPRTPVGKIDYRALEEMYTF